VHKADRERGGPSWCILRAQKRVGRKAISDDANQFHGVMIEDGGA